jgi:hypothetical protein
LDCFCALLKSGTFIEKDQQRSHGMRFYGLFFLGLMACETSDHFDKKPIASTGGASSASTALLTVCETGRQYLCHFSDGSYGAQLCKPDRSGYTDCMPLYDAVPLGGSGTGGATSATTRAAMQTGGTSAAVTTFRQTGGMPYVASTTRVVTGGYASVQATGGRQTGGTSAFISQAHLSSQTGGMSTGGTTPFCTDADRDGECATSDCNDLDSRMRHGNLEICGNGLDDDCSGSGDCSDSVCMSLDSCKVDQDQDGYPAGEDCNDLDNRMNKGRPEICNNGLDDDCDGFDCTNANCSCILE